MAKKSNVLFVGTGRYVCALRADSGVEIWRTKLPSSMGQIVSLMLDGDRLIVGHAGRVYGLDTRDGAIIWENGLSRMGYGVVLMATSGVTASMGAVLAAAQIAASSAAAAGGAAAAAGGAAVAGGAAG